MCSNTSHNECLYNGNVINRHFCLIVLFSHHSLYRNAIKMEMSSHCRRVFLPSLFKRSEKPPSLICNETRPSSCLTAHIRLGSDSLDTIFMIYICVRTKLLSIPYQAVPLFPIDILLDLFFLRYDQKAISILIRFRANDDAKLAKRHAQDVVN